MKLKLLGLIFLLFASNSLAQRTMTIIGVGQIDTTADIAVIGYKIEGIGSNLRNAVQSTLKKNKTIIEVLKTKGVKQESIESSDFYSGKNKEWRPFFSSKKKDFKASITVSVEIDNFNILEEVMYTLSEQDIKNLSDVVFKLKDSAKFQEMAKMKAIENAQNEAEKIGIKLGVKVISVAKYEEFSQENKYSRIQHRISFFDRKQLWGEYPTPPLIESISPDKIRVEKHVQVIFNIE